VNPGEGAGTLLKLFGQAKPTISVSTLRRSAGIIRIDMNTSAVPILKQKIVTLINLNLRAADISKVCAPITPCFDVFDHSHNTEPRNMELMARMRTGEYRGPIVGQFRGKNRSCCKSGHDVPGTYAPDPCRFVSSISCSRCGS